MGRYPGQKRRASTQKTYAMDICYSKVVTEAKRIHRAEGKFYIVKVYYDKYFTSVNQTEFDLDYKNNNNFECWEFIDKRWRKTGHCI